MVVWKSSPNGKSEPISRRNNSLFRNLSGSDLTFVSCQVQSSGGWEGLQLRSCTLHYKLWQFWTCLKLSDDQIFRDKGRIVLPTQHVHTLAVSFVRGLDLIQEHTLVLWPWVERWSREEWTMLPELARALTLSRPHFFSFAFVSLICSCFLSVFFGELGAIPLQGL